MDRRISVMGGCTVRRLATSQGHILHVPWVRKVVKRQAARHGMDGTGGASSSPRGIVRYTDAPSCSSADVILAARAVEFSAVYSAHQPHRAGADGRRPERPTQRGKDQAGLGRCSNSGRPRLDTRSRRKAHTVPSVHTDRRTMAGRPHVMAGCILALNLATTTGRSDPNTPYTSRNYPNILDGRVENEQLRLRHAMYGGVLAAAVTGAATHMVPVKGAQCLLASIHYLGDWMYVHARRYVHTCLLPR